MARQVDNSGSTYKSSTTASFRAADQKASTPKPAAQPANNPLAWLQNVGQQFTNTVHNASTAAQHAFSQGGQAVAQGVQYAAMNPIQAAAQAGQGVANYAANIWQNSAQTAFRNNPNQVNPYTNGGADFRRDQQQRAAAPAGVFGVDYGPNWTRSDYNPAYDIDPDTGQPFGQSWRQDLGKILMTPDEYLRRQQSWREQYTPGYMDWQRAANAAASTLPPAQYNAWKQANPQPSGFLQTQQEYIVRNNAAPTGYTYVPFGSGYIKNPTLPSVPSTPSASSSGGRGYGYGYGGYGGGGGGGYDYGSQPVANFYNQLANWRVLEIQGG